MGRLILRPAVVAWPGQVVIVVIAIACGSPGVVYGLHDKPACYCFVTSEQGLVTAVPDLLPPCL